MDAFQNKNGCITAFHNQLARGNVLSGKHDFQVPRPSQSASISRGDVLSADRYIDKVATVPTPFLKCSNYTAKPCCYSPQAQDLGAPYADLPITDRAIKERRRTSYNTLGWACAFTSCTIWWLARKRSMGSLTSSRRGHGFCAVPA